MRRHEIVRRQLRFDIRLGNDSPNPEIHSLKNLRNVKIDINHRHIKAVIVVVLEQLVAEKSARNHETIIKSVNAGDAKTPIDVIGLEFIRNALDVENELVLLYTVRAQIVNQRKIRVRSAGRVRGRADVPGKIFPAIDLNFTSPPCVSVGPGINRFH